MTEPDLKALALLREPFPASHIGKLPKGGTTLDFLGHGYLTARFLDADPSWNWRPMAFDERGLPAFDEFGGLWMYLTVGGVERPGYGDSGGKKGPNAIKEAIGDALRNSGLRFGAALDLWCKGDVDAPEPKTKPLPAHVAKLAAVAKKHNLDTKALGQRFENDYGLSVMHADPKTVLAFAQMVSDEAAVDEAVAK